MSVILERLRNYIPGENDDEVPLRIKEAADEIERLREVLRPFADIIEMVECTSSHEYYDTDTWEVPIAFLRIARRALNRVPAEGKSL